MVQRFLKIVAVLLATGGLALVAPAVARADSTTPAVSNSTENTTTTTVTDSNTTTVVNNDTTQDSTSQTQSSDDKASPLATAVSDSTAEASADKSAEATASVQVADKPAGLSSAAVVVTGGPTPPAMTTHEKIVQSMHTDTTSAAVMSNADSAPLLPLGVSESNPPAGHAPARAPMPAQGALMGISGTLAATVVPQFSRLLGNLVSANQTGLAAGLLPSLVILIVILTVGSQFVEQLRRAGFHRAARGDGEASPTNFFATPVKMDANWAVKPSYTSIFYGVRNTNLSKVAQCF